MALPSAHRPAELGPLGETVVEAGSSLKTLKIDKKEIFMNEMIEWYKNKLNRRQRTALTKKRVIRHATTVAYRLVLPYENLPKDWLRTLYEEHGVIFKFPKKVKEQEEEIKKEREELSMAIFDRKIIDLTKEPPPSDWMTAYIEGIAKPRTFKAFKNPAGVTVVYYDYDAQVGEPDDGSPLDDVCHTPSDRDGVLPALE